MAKNVGKLASELFHLKNTKANHNAAIKLINGDIKLIEASLLKEMEDQGLMKVADANGTVYISRQVVPSVVNWDEFYDYIRTHNYFHLLERRPSRGAYRESYEQGEQVPGVDPVLFDEVRTRKT
jgi:hypothetical protein